MSKPPYLPARGGGRSDSLPLVSETCDWPDDPAERVRELVEGVLDELDLDGEVEIEEDDDRIAVSSRARTTTAC